MGFPLDQSVGLQGMNFLFTNFSSKILYFSLFQSFIKIMMFFLLNLNFSQSSWFCDFMQNLAVFCRVCLQMQYLMELQGLDSFVTLMITL